MKNGKRPTKAQKIAIKKAGLNYENWFVIKSLPDELQLVHRYTTTQRKIYL